MDVLWAVGGGFAGTGGRWVEMVRRDRGVCGREVRGGMCGALEGLWQAADAERRLRGG